MVSVDLSTSSFPPSAWRLGINNEPPTIDESRIILRIQSTLEQEVFKLDDELEILEKKRSSLLTKRSEVVDQLATCKNIRAPIRSVPTDILSEIFIECAMTDIDENHKGLWREKRVLQAPLLLLHICSSWRSIALNLPRLWSVFIFPVGDWVVDKGSKVEKYLRLGQEWCSRAKGIPLSIDFLAHPIPGAQYNIRLLASVILGSNLSSIKKLRFHSRHLVDRLQYLPPGTFEQLDSLILRDESASSAAHLPLFHNSPNLRRVSLSNTLTKDTMSNLPLPRSQLTHLVILNFIDIYHWTTLLSECDNLTYGVFYLDNKHGAMFPCLDNKSSLSFLSDLTLIFLENLDPRAIQNFIFPALKSLRLGSSSRDTQTYWVEEQAHRFYDQIRGLTQLSIMNSWCPSIDTLLSILRATPYLKVLDLNLHLDHGKLFDALLKPENGILLDLDVLSLRYGTGAFSVPLFCAFAKSSLLSRMGRDSSVSSPNYCRKASKEVIFQVSRIDASILNEVNALLAPEEEAHELVISLLTTQTRAHWKDRLKGFYYTWDDGLI